MIKKHPDNTNLTSDVFCIVVKGDKVLWLPEMRQFPLLTKKIAKSISATEVGMFENRLIYYVSEYKVDLSHFAEAAWFSLSDLLLDAPADLFEYAAKAFSFNYFYQTNKFCGRCGTRMRSITWEIAKHCDKCHHRCYPRVSPCIIVVITHGTQILLAKGKRSKTGSYSALAGFIEPGETAEQAVHREVQEEVGVKIKNINYFGSQAWPFPHNMMLGFTAEYDKGDIVIDTREIADAKWFELDTLPKTPGLQSIAGKLIEWAVNNKEEKNKALQV
ncbi:NAD(+) diphosphatase [Algibacillus agarilyticus]|uniref:NAD(+) diphosphatase n=1 Tax=Algibacillus agarilyticus TaxID=2234133 RepID=UPI000DCF7214|nr:NAD(+) diphosphatase [Algibacillus agarilyticus]